MSRVRHKYKPIPGYAGWSDMMGDFCTDSVGSSPIIPARNWKDVTCKRCLAKRPVGRGNTIISQKLLTKLVREALRAQHWTET